MTMSLSSEGEPVMDSSPADVESLARAYGRQVFHAAHRVLGDRAPGRGCPAGGLPAPARETRRGGRVLAGLPDHDGGAAGDRPPAQPATLATSSAHLAGQRPGGIRQYRARRHEGRTRTPPACRAGRAQGARSGMLHPALHPGPGDRRDCAGHRHDTQPHRRVPASRHPQAGGTPRRAPARLPRRCCDEHEPVPQAPRTPRRARHPPSPAMADTRPAPARSAAHAVRAANRRHASGLAG